MADKFRIRLSGDRFDETMMCYYDHHELHFRVATERLSELVQSFFSKGWLAKHKAEITLEKEPTDG